MNALNTLLAFIAVFGLLVFVHEWGHLVFAKRAGILCENLRLDSDQSYFHLNAMKPFIPFDFYRLAAMSEWQERTRSWFKLSPAIK